jgi:hypothetical protein
MNTTSSPDRAQHPQSEIVSEGPKNGSKQGLKNLTKPSFKHDSQKNVKQLAQPMLELTKDGLKDDSQKKLSPLALGLLKAGVDQHFP